MRALVDLFEELGAADIRTYIQSGNVVFAASAVLARRLPRLAGQAIGERFGFRAPVVVRSVAALVEVARHNPFLAAGAAPGHLHVAFLADPPDSARVAALDPTRSPPDEFQVRGSDIYLHLPNGVARSKLTNAYLDTTLQTTCTIRNWTTVQALVDLASR